MRQVKQLLLEQVARKVFFFLKLIIHEVGLLHCSPDWKITFRKWAEYETLIETTTIKVGIKVKGFDR